MVQKRRTKQTLLPLLVPSVLLLCFVSRPVTPATPASRSLSPGHTKAASQPAVVPASQPASHLTCAPECGQAGTGVLSKVRMAPTALYSFPGSGSTWVRHMLTTASGLLTGVVYRSEIDVPALGNASHRVLAVKTHRSPGETLDDVSYKRALILVRNPYDALLAKFNRKGDYGTRDKHVKGTAVRPEEDFETEWPSYPHAVFDIWRRRYLQWAESPVPVHVIVFSRLVVNLEQELRHVLSFLNESSIIPRIHCAVLDSEGPMHREKPDWLGEKSVFSDKDKAKINRGIDEVQKALETKTGESFQDLQMWKK